MNTKFSAKTFVSTSIAGAAILLAVAGGAQAASPRAEYDDFIDARVLEVSGQTFVSIEDTLKARRAAAARAEAEKAAPAIAKAQDTKPAEKQ